MADWQTTDGGVAAAAGDTNGDTSFDTTALTGAITEVEQTEYKTKANEAGWADTIPVNYNVQQTTRDEEATRYAADSAVYEWADDYGEVGPEVPELEEQLYNGAFRLRQGNHMNTLQLEVTVEGPDKIQPARSVSVNMTSNSLDIANSKDSLTRPACTLLFKRSSPRKWATSTRRPFRRTPFLRCSTAPMSLRSPRQVCLLPKACRRSLLNHPQALAKLLLT